MGVILSYAAIGVQFAIAFAYTPFVLRVLGQAEYGLYTLAVSLVGYLNLLSFGLGSAYMRFYSTFRARGESDGIEGLNGLFLSVFLTGGLVALGSGVALSFVVEPLIGARFTGEQADLVGFVVLVLSASMCATLVSSVFNAYILAHERFVLQKSLQIVQTLASPICAVPVLMHGGGAVGMTVVTAGVNVAAAGYAAFFAVRRLGMRFKFRPFDRQLLRAVSGFSGYIFLNMIVDQVYWNADKFIVARIRGAEEVAVYGIASQIISIYMLLSIGISNVFVPRVNAVIAANMDDSYISALFARVGRMQFVVLALVLSSFILFGRPFIELWAGTLYSRAYAIALVVMVPLTIPLVQNLGIEIQRAMDLHKFRSWVFLVFAVLNLGLSVALTLSCGAFGAAASSALCLLFANGLIMNWYYARRVGLSVGWFWRSLAHLLRGIAPAALFGAALVWWIKPNAPLQLVVTGAVYIVVYCLLVARLGLTHDERVAIRIVRA